MHRIRRFHRPVDAWSAASYLWRHGVVASVHVANADAALVRVRFDDGSCELFIARKEDEAEALRLLAEFDENPPAFEPDWESDLAQPDLSQLDDSYAVSCPACAEALPLDESVSVCPACAAEVDIAELVVNRHGPECLEHCYPEPPPLLPDEVIDAAAIWCPNCQYSLQGLEREGACPECGEPYRKREIIQQWIG